jgi:Uma2 family endonuclease
MRRQHAHRRRARFWEGTDLAIEVVSSEGRKRDLEIKRDEYAHAGIPEYWIVDPELQEIQVLVLENSEYRVHGAFGMGADASSIELPGFSVSVEAVFRSVEEPF